MTAAARSGAARPWVLAARWIGVLLAIALSAVAVRTEVDGRRQYVAFEHVRTTPALEVTIDVSEPGCRDATFRHVLAGSCWSSLWVAREDLPDGDPAALAGLTGRFVVRDAAGEVVADEPFAVQPGGEGLAGIRLGELPTDLSPGDYAAALIIETPAASAGRVSLRGTYRLCGLEIFPAYANFAVAGLAGVAAASLAAALAWRLIRPVRGDPGAAGGAAA